MYFLKYFATMLHHTRSSYFCHWHCLRDHCRIYACVRVISKWLTLLTERPSQRFPFIHLSIIRLPVSTVWVDTLTLHMYKIRALHKMGSSIHQAVNPHNQTAGTKISLHLVRPDYEPGRLDIPLSSRLNAHSPTHWAIGDQAKTLHSIACTCTHTCTHFVAGMR